MKTPNPDKVTEMQRTYHMPMPGDSFSIGMKLDLGGVLDTDVSVADIDTASVLCKAALADVLRELGFDPDKETPNCTVWQPRFFFGQMKPQVYAGAFVRKADRGAFERELLKRGFEQVED